MKILPSVCCSLFAVALQACSTVDALQAERVGTAQLSMANGVPVGTAQLLASGDNLSIAVMVTGLEPGAHGFHLHTTGKCEGPDFSSAGGHLNPGNKAHGSKSPDGKHLGDLPNLKVGQSGTATADVDLGRDPSDLLESLFDADGTAVMIHAGPDDYRSDPAGAAGPRIVCGVLKPA